MSQSYENPTEQAGNFSANDYKKFHEIFAEVTNNLKPHTSEQKKENLLFLKGLIEKIFEEDDSQKLLVKREFMEEYIQVLGTSQNATKNRSISSFLGEFFYLINRASELYLEDLGTNEDLVNFNTSDFMEKSSNLLNVDDTGKLGGLPQNFRKELSDRFTQLSISTN